MGIGGNAEEAGLVESNLEEEGMLGIDGGEMYTDCRFWWWWIWGGNGVGLGVRCVRGQNWG